MKKIVLGLVCAMSFSFATTSEDNQKKVSEILKEHETKIENLKKQLHSNDSEETIKYWEEEANQGDVTAQFIIARTYYYNVKDYKKAIEWYEKAANQGYAKAQFNLGLMYDNGKGVRQDYKKAFEWWEKAATQGYAPAQYNLGLMYDNGWGQFLVLPKDSPWFGSFYPTDVGSSSSAHRDGG